MTPETLGEKIVALTRAALAPRWQAHPEFDDILAQGLYEAWRCFREAEQVGQCPPLAAAAFGARLGPSQWFRRWMGRDVAGEPRHLPCASLEFLLDENESPWEPSAPDEIGPALERLESKRLWAEWSDLLTPNERRVLTWRIFEEWTFPQCAAALGRSPARAHQLENTGIARIRAHLGLPPETPHSRTSKRFVPDTARQRHIRARDAAKRAQKQAVR